MLKPGQSQANQDTGHPAGCQRTSKVSRTPGRLEGAPCHPPAPTVPTPSLLGAVSLWRSSFTHQRDNHREQWNNNVERAVD